MGQPRWVVGFRGRAQEPAPTMKGAWDAAGGHRDPPLRLGAGDAGVDSRFRGNDEMRGLGALCVILFCVALSGCTTSREIVRSPDVPAEVARQALDDLVVTVSKRFPPAKIPLAIHDNDPGSRLEPVLRAAGYAVHQTGDINPVTFSTHYMRESAMYLGVIRVGLNYTLSRLYIFEGGELQVQSTSLSDDAGAYSTPHSAPHPTETTGDSNRD